MKKIIWTIGFVIISAFLFGCSARVVNGQATQNLTISAAASLKEPMEELKLIFEKENRANITFNFGGSGTLQKQIEQGAPVDIFISAGEQQFKALEDKERIQENSKVELLENQLVFIVNNEYKANINSIESIKNIDGKISLGEVNSVPVGQYGEKALNYYNILDDFKGNIVYAKDVKQVLSYVESGEVVGGIVYKSDALNLRKSSIVTVFKEETCGKITYPAGIIESSNNKELGKSFMEFLKSSEAIEIFEKYGFKVPRE
ncbi:molybdate ABC transporter substrate-binding protein [Clostridium tunisiense]|uniref:molybdate ABC transporter substrate-binding protein n=1 Tax=Clostridium tunisiense TaxID=219748 RepID=UPI000312A54C|nr:molybdate ABC transporter substrate-binding protein [Clostridium tunisiense]